MFLRRRRSGETVYAADSKSAARKGLRVQVSSPAPAKLLGNSGAGGGRGSRKGKRRGRYLGASRFGGRLRASRLTCSEWRSGPRCRPPRKAYRPRRATPEVRARVERSRSPLPLASRSGCGTDPRAPCAAFPSGFPSLACCAQVSVCRWCGGGGTRRARRRPLREHPAGTIPTRPHHRT